MSEKFRNIINKLSEAKSCIEECSEPHLASPDLIQKSINEIKEIETSHDKLKADNKALLEALKYAIRFLRQEDCDRDWIKSVITQAKKVEI